MTLRIAVLSFMPAKRFLFILALDSPLTYNIPLLQFARKLLEKMYSSLFLKLL